MGVSCRPFSWGRQMFWAQRVGRAAQSVLSFLPLHFKCTLKCSQSLHIYVPTTRNKQSHSFCKKQKAPWQVPESLHNVHCALIPELSCCCCEGALRGEWKRGPEWPISSCGKPSAPGVIRNTRGLSLPWEPQAWCHTAPLCKPLPICFWESR